MYIKPAKKRLQEETITMRVLVTAVIIVVIIMVAAYFIGAQFRLGDDTVSKDTASADTDTDESNINTEESDNGVDTDTEPPETDTEPPETDTEPSETDTEPPETDTEPPETETEPPETETEPPETEPKPPETEPKPPETEPKPPETEPQPPETEPEPPETEPEPPETEPEPPETLEVYIDGVLQTEFTAVMREGTACVPIGKYTQAMDSRTARSWDGESMTYTVSADGLCINARAGKCYIEINERFIFCPTDVFTGSDDIIRAPVEVLALAFNAQARIEDGAVYCTLPSGYMQSANEFYNEDELYWLSHIINAEAGTEPMTGKLAVGAVIMNRVADGGFPDTIKDVIFDNDTGIQFSPAYSGSIYKDPNRDSIIAAKLCLEGYIYDKRVLFFSMNDNSWASKNREYLFTIDGHDFYA